MNLTSSSVVSMAADVVAASLGSEAALLNLNTGSYFGLNPSAAFIWDQLSVSRDYAYLLGAMIERYDADENVLANDLETLLDEFSKHGLIVLES